MDTTSIPEREEAIINEFMLFDDWMGKYEYLIELGKDLPLIEEAYKTDDFRIRGCQSQVWLRPDRARGHVEHGVDRAHATLEAQVALGERAHLDGLALLEAVQDVVARVRHHARHLHPGRGRAIGEGDGCQFRASTVASS